MLKGLMKNTSLIKELNASIKKYPSIADIFIFGSVTHGKAKANDIDVLLLFNKEVDRDTEYEIRKRLEGAANIPIDIVSKGYTELFNEGFIPRQNILSDGISVRMGRPLSQCFGYSPYYIFRINTREKSAMEKVKLHQALYGRKGKGGLAGTIGAHKLGPGVMLISVDKRDEMHRFLEHWTIEYREAPVLWPGTYNWTENK